MEKKKFFVKLIGIIFDPVKRKILLGRRKDEKYFSFLRGYLNYDEDLDLELKRITKERTGYKIHNLGAVFAKNNIAQDEKTLELYFLCEATEGKEKKGPKIAELKWIKAKEFGKLTNKKVPPRLKEYLLHITG